MYFYIYDSFLSEKKYERTLAAVETRLTDLGISGKIGRLSPFTSAKGLIRDEAKRGTETVIVVGNDETVSKAVEGIGEVKVTFGMIPIGSPTTIARALGIPEGVEACEVLSKRVTQKIDLGKVNGKFFLSSVRIPGDRVVIEGDGQYRISTLASNCEIIVSNLRSGEMMDSNQGSLRNSGDPMDGMLDTLIMNRGGGLLGFSKRGAGKSSIIPLRSMNIRSAEPIEVVADGSPFTNDTFNIEVVPDCLKVITGRERIFAQI
jgi:diacylglycerol kinase family enzyme